MSFIGKWQGRCTSSNNCSLDIGGGVGLGEDAEELTGAVIALDCGTRAAWLVADADSAGPGSIF
jgi:hypothetical protein